MQTRHLVLDRTINVFNIGSDDHSVFHRMIKFLPRFDYNGEINSAIKTKHFDKGYEVNIDGGS